jgi:hypothetical protein
MDPNTTPKSRDDSNGADEQETESIAAPSRSSHVIDLRQGGAKPPQRRAARPPVESRQPDPEGKVDTKPDKKDKEKPLPKKSAKTTPPTDSKEELFDGDVLSSPQNKRRFWPAFARFLALLITLGLIIVGGLYLYVTYYQS